MKAKHAAAIIIVVLIAAIPSKARPWTDDTGKHTAEAELFGIKGNEVRLKTPQGKVISISLTRLSKADQVYVEGRTSTFVQDLESLERRARRAESMANDLQNKFTVLANRARDLEKENQLLRQQKQNAVAPPQQAAAAPQRAPAIQGMPIPAAPLGVAPRTPVTLGKQYSGDGGGHWLQEKSDDGSIIILEDNSIWKVAKLDTIDTRLWLATTSIAVIENDNGSLPYLLVNTDDGEKVEADYMGHK